MSWLCILVDHCHPLLCSATVTQTMLMSLEAKVSNLSVVTVLLLEVAWFHGHQRSKTLLQIQPALLNTWLFLKLAESLFGFELCCGSLVMSLPRQLHFYATIPLLSCLVPISLFITALNIWMSVIIGSVGTSIRGSLL